MSYNSKNKVLPETIAKMKELKAQGESNTKIGLILNYSPFTVDYHINPKIREGFLRRAKKHYNTYKEEELKKSQLWRHTQKTKYCSCNFIPIKIMSS